MDDVTRAQKNEITEHYLYLALAKRASGKNKQTLTKIAEDEKKHYEFWRNITKTDVKPNMCLVHWYVFLSMIFGLTFAIKLRESDEQHAQVNYAKMPRAKAVIKDEQRHEQQLISLIVDDRLSYASSIVLGLNDGLIELTGVLAGLTFALKETHIVAIAGLVTGVAAALSMAASGYFASKEDHGKNPVRAALYIGVAYLLVVAILIAPYLLFANVYIALVITLFLAVLIIAVYTFYISVAKNESFTRRFLEMFIISMAVAAISFIVGILLDHWFGIRG